MDAEYEVTVGDYEIGVDIDAYHYEPPSKKCAQLCETPDEYYGYTELEYHIKFISDGEKDQEGDGLDIPVDISVSELDDAILEAIKGAGF